MLRLISALTATAAFASKDDPKWAINQGQQFLVDEEITLVRKAVNDPKLFTEEKHELLQKWVDGKRANLRKGYRTIEELGEAQEYFADKVRHYEATSEKVRKQIEENRVKLNKTNDFYSQEEARIAQLSNSNEQDAWQLYATMVARNNQKRRSLRKLARISCEIGGKGWNDECDTLNAFYMKQKDDIKQLVMNSEAMIADYNYALKSDSYLGIIRKQTESLIAENNNKSIKLQNKIHET